MPGQRRRIAVATTGLAGLLLAGCGLPAGVDGDLTGSWAVLPEPASFSPSIGSCHGDYQETRRLDDYDPVACGEQHLAEHAFLGEFTGAAADRATPPPTASPEWQAAYQECETGVADYLGADFRYARLWLGVTVPSTEAWEGGARWFGCEVVELTDRRGDEQSRSGSLAGALADGSEMLLGCFQVELDSNDRIDEMIELACEEEHQAEFVGVWHAPDGPYLALGNESNTRQVHAGCRETVAEYVDLPVDDDLEFRTGTIADWMDESDWDNGDRGFRCYLWIRDADFTRSLAGAGPSALPVR